MRCVFLLLLFFLAGCDSAGDAATGSPLSSDAANVDSSVSLSSSSSDQTSSSSIHDLSSVNDASLTNGLPDDQDWCFIPENCGTFTDERDGKRYNWTKIGSQIWMAQNLNYDIGWESYCPHNDCEGFGRLYNWYNAMDSAESTDLVPSGIRGVCPQGWHLPSDREWEVMASFIASQIGEILGEGKNDYHQIGVYLKADTTWLESEFAQTGKDAYGFSALAAGRRVVYTSGGRSPHYDDEGSMAIWWTATKPGNWGGYAYHRQAFYDDDGFSSNTTEIHSQNSIRCVKDNEEEND